MATYIKGADTYLPNTKPFTPDYKFLSTVLQTRTDKYNANYKATNDIYNRVVYSDLSREDTRERRDQYAEQIAPQIEKISGLDLSIQSNVDAAKGVFAPFYEDDVTVKDMLFTSKYKDQSQRAQNLLNSPDQTVQEKYWDVGVRAMQYKMDEFINADSESALRMALPQYVPKANLFKLSSELLSNMEPPLNMEMDRFNSSKNPNYNSDIPESRENPKLIYNTDWIITEQNGALVTGAALQTIKNNLLTNPAVQRSYQTEAYVSGMDWANQAVKNGVATSISNGQEMWAKETIRRIGANNKVELSNDLESLRKAEASAVNWSNFQGSNGIVPGGQLDKLNKERLSTLEKYKLEIESKKQIALEAERPSPTRGNLLNKAYNLYMQSNISNDMQSAAQDWSARNYTRKMTANPFAVDEKKAKYDMAKINARSQNQLIRDRINNDRKDANTLLDKGYKYDNNGNLIKLPWAEGSNSMSSPFDKGSVIFNDPNALDFKTKDNKINENVDVIGDFFVDHANDVNTMLPIKLDAIFGNAESAGMLAILNPLGNTEDKNSEYTITIPGKNKNTSESIVFKGDISSLKRQILNQVESNPEIINKIYNKIKSDFTDTKKQTLANPNLTTGDNKPLYTGMIERLNEIDQKQNGIDVRGQEIHKVALNAAKINDISNTVQNNKDIKGFIDNGFPSSIFTSDGMVESLEDYQTRVIGLVKEGAATNYDAIGIDKGTSDKKYYKDMDLSTGKKEYLNYVDGVDENNRTVIRKEYSDFPIPNARKSVPVTSILYTDDTTGKVVRSENRDQLDSSRRKVKVLDEYQIKLEAAKVYNALYNELNASLQGRRDINTPSTSYASLLEGVRGETYSNLGNNAAFSMPVNPLNPSKDAIKFLKGFNDQINSMKSKGIIYGVGLGDIQNQDQKLKQDPLALEVLEAYKQDMSSWLSQKSSPTSSKNSPISNITYYPVYGVAKTGNKNTAAYKIDEWSNWIEGQRDRFGDEKVDKIKDAGGIFIVFPQDNDLNPKAKNNRYDSKVFNDIMANGGNYKNYYGSKDNGITSSGELRITRNGTGNYTMTLTTNEYNPKPSDPDKLQNWEEYTSSTRGPEAMSFVNDLEGIDLHVEELIEGMRKLEAQNSRLRKLDQQKN